MILEYEGFSKSPTMILEEADSISYTYVHITDEYKRKCKEIFNKEIAPKCETSDELDLKEADFYTKKLLKYIKEESNSIGIPDLKIPKPNIEIWDKTSCIIVVSMFVFGKSSKSYLFEPGQKVFILNDSGKTVMKL